MGSNPAGPTIFLKSQNDIALIYCPCRDAAEAERLARQLLLEKLIVCANIMSPQRALYLWQGEIEFAAECALLLKTAIEKKAAASARLADLHSYDVPAILSWVATANVAFAAWTEDCLQEKTL